jgi:hypothetical protein
LESSAGCTGTWGAKLVAQPILSRDDSALAVTFASFVIQTFHFFAWREDFQAASC